jgi:hypothetical protein
VVEVVAVVVQAYREEVLTSLFRQVVVEEEVVTTPQLLLGVWVAEVETRQVVLRGVRPVLQMVGVEEPRVLVEAEEQVEGTRDLPAQVSQEVREQMGETRKVLMEVARRGEVMVEGTVE